eukprot:CAMPEP_0115828956 /NCGR_PEP_ID=MMETSP0287-20121206/847_1 /TAXON_ID=412157 /ORGANISM="Chrysochromulina rotalis, Strain UIO044" /LENGTH=74 /DNA_ID=CAMNT_0003282201 /DNA_START=64 /DNA_END=288 /DNA_ORIENTATION=-
MSSAPKTQPPQSPPPSPPGVATSGIPPMPFDSDYQSKMIAEQVAEQEALAKRYPKFIQEKVNREYARVGQVPPS